MNTSKLIPVLALMLATTLALPSCKDDDEPKDSGTDHTGTEEEGEAIEGAEANAKALKFWDVASQLVGTSAYTTDYADATFEPTIGTLEGNTSIVLVNDMQAAAQKFANLTGADIDEETDTYTYNDPEVGTLTYTKVNDGTTWATVNVSIKQIPHLEKIIFRNSTDDNGSFGEQKAWYRFGDVVKRQNADGKTTEYWICVRPAFTYEKKEDSHWVCVSKLSKSNIYNWEYPDLNTKYYLPTKVGTDKENMQNFAEMLYAICYPQEWYDNCVNHHTDKLIGYSGMPIFSDFHAKYIKYHNQYFWQNVQEAWKNTHEIQSEALNLKLSEISRVIKTDGINLLYKGYSWWTTKGYCDLYNASYTNGSSDKEQNLHKAQYDTYSSKIYTFTVDCRYMGNDLRGYDDFFEEKKYRWVIRHATGKDLNNGIQPAATAEIQGVKEVYRYYSYYPDEKARKSDNDGNGPEVSVAITRNEIVDDVTKQNISEFRGGVAHYWTGDVYKDENGHRWFVVSMAGNPNNLTYKEAAPYSELVSFDGLEVSSDGKYITNLGTLQQTVRANLFLHNIWENTYASGLNGQGNFPKIATHIFEHTGVDLTTLYQTVVAKSEDPRNPTSLATIAYYDPDKISTSNGQPLLRYLYPIDLSNAEPPVYYWQHYVTEPDVKSEAYTETQYSTAPIYLQDVAQEQKVEAYAPDFYSNQPLYGKGYDTKKIRKSRSKPDEQATTISNYFYDYEKWNKWDTDQHPTDMWQEPVLMFRVTAVYDRGKHGYSTKTVDGHTLTLVSQLDAHVKVDEEAREDPEFPDIVKSAYAGLEGEWSSCHKQTNYWDGKLFSHPTWQEAWK